MRRVRFLAAVIFAALALSACGGNAPATSSSPTTTVIPPAATREPVTQAEVLATVMPEVLATIMPDLPADVAATARELATNPTAMASLQATIMAEKPTEDGCDPNLQNVNAERSTLKAAWTPDARINLNGTLDAPDDATFFVFVYNNGAPIYWANFPEVKPANKTWDFTTTTPAGDDVVMGDLARQNPYEPGDKICVGVTALKAGVNLTDLTDAKTAQEALIAQLRLPVGGTAPAAVVLPTANPASGAGICNELGDLPLAKFKDLASLLAGAYADAQKGAKAWQADARLYKMRVKCAVLGGVRWDFSWVSDAAQQAAENSAKEPTIAAEGSTGPSYEDAGKSQTIDPTAVPITLDKLGEALIGAGFSPTHTVSIVAR